MARRFRLAAGAVVYVGGLAALAAVWDATGSQALQLPVIAGLTLVWALGFLSSPELERVDGGRMPPYRVVVPSLLVLGAIFATTVLLLPELGLGFSLWAALIPCLEVERALSLREIRRHGESTWRARPQSSHVAAVGGVATAAIVGPIVAFVGRESAGEAIVVSLTCGVLVGALVLAITMAMDRASGIDRSGS